MSQGGATTTNRRGAPQEGHRIRANEDAKVADFSSDPVSKADLDRQIKSGFPLAQCSTPKAAKDPNSLAGRALVRPGESGTQRF